MEKNTSAWYAAFKAKDARFDGRFFVGISSTGIYCRPICRAKMPKEDNCFFYGTAAAAEHAGYRPCLMCRPELAPGSAPIDASSTLVRRAARLFEENCGNGQNLEEYVQRLGYSTRHLRRVFATELHVSPVQYLQTCRLLLAKSLLTDTDLSVLDVAMAAGFGSLRRFNDLFKKQYQLSPTALRKQVADTKTDSTDITLLLGYRPPYQWQQMVDFLAARAIPGVEVVSNDCYMRTVHYFTADEKHVYGWVRVTHRPEKNSLAVTVSAALLPALPHILARVKNLFDLHCYPEAVYEALSQHSDPQYDFFVPGTRLPGCFEPFELSVRAVLGQQITVKAARTLAGRFVEAFGTPVDTGIEGLTHSFPTVHDILALEGSITDHLGPLGIIATRARTILGLAQKIAHNEIDFALCAQPEEEVKKLMSVPGIGTWTAQYIAMRAMDWPDAFPHTDHGVKKALAPLSENEILQLAEAWRPWRGYATISLWNSLST